MSIAALIVAAGRGLRAGDGLPKQYRPLAGRPVLFHTINAVLREPRITSLRVVIHGDDLALFQQVIRNTRDPRLLPPVIGGENRSASVRAGLNATNAETVLIHDAARPLLPLKNLSALIDRLEQSSAAFLALPVTDALWQVTEDKAQSAQPRDMFWRAQTPQGFRLADLKAAYDSTLDPADDDVAMARRAGIEVVVVPGSERNLKITRREDFALAEKLMETGLDIRTGNGYDVHQLGAGEQVTLCGIRIPFHQGLIGHSDADVAMHAITDAIFGALAKGDIGQWFPPDDEKWKGADSEIFLQKAVNLAAQDRFYISHLDCTIICELPKIGPHATAMRENIARITALPLDKISVKATTSEKLGFTGRGEGIAAQATATLLKQ